MQHLCALLREQQHIVIRNALPSQRIGAEARVGGIDPVHIGVDDEFIGVKSSKAKGKRVSTYEVAKLEFIEPLDKAPEPDEEELEEGEDGPIDLSVDPEDYSNAKQMDLGL